MDAKILIMKTQDWGNMTYQSFIKQLISSNGVFFARGITDQYREQIIANLSHWAKFPLPYPQYRQKLKELATASWDKLNCQRRLIELGWPQNPDCAYLFTDDDDWYHPDVIREILPHFEQRPEIQFVTWDCWLYSVVWYREEYLLCPIIGSNGYAVRGGHRPFSGGGGHNYVEDYKKQHPENVVHIPKALSVWVRHPGAFCHLAMHDIKHPFSRLERVPRPDCLAWASSYTDTLYDLVRTLIPKPI